MAFLLPDPHSTLRLHLNENTGGCAPAVLAALRTLDAVEAAAYPNAAPATAAAERYFGVLEGWVQLTDGLDDGLRAIAEIARMRPLPAGATRGEAVIVDPTFDMYEVYVAGVGLDLVRVPTAADFAFPGDALIAALTARTRLVYLADPNNPTGQPMPEGAAARIASATPEALVLVDEAYAEFSGHTLIGEDLDRHRQLVVGRTFAKAFGLAGLRVGALIAHPDTLAPLRRSLPPFSVNVCALIALVAALGDLDHMRWYVAQAASSREAIYQFCRERHLRCWPSEGNFVLVDLGPRAAEVIARAASEHVLVSSRAHQRGCAGLVRITAGIVEDTRLGLEALGRALGN